jgi:hypothetical protein
VSKRFREDFGKALARKEWEKAWDIANDLWWGNGRWRSAVLYEMMLSILEEKKKEQTP